MSRGRPKKEIVIPFGLHQGQAVKITSKEYPRPKLGLIVGICKYDGGIEVWLTGKSKDGPSVYACIQPDRGDTIEGIEVDKTSEYAELERSVPPL